MKKEHFTKWNATKAGAPFCRWGKCSRPQIGQCKLGVLRLPTPDESSQEPPYAHFRICIIIHDNAFSFKTAPGGPSWRCARRVASLGNRNAESTEESQGYHRLRAWAGTGQNASPLQLPETARRSRPRANSTTSARGNHNPRRTARAHGGPKREGPTGAGCVKGRTGEGRKGRVGRTECRRHAPRRKDGREPAADRRMDDEEWASPRSERI